MEDIIAMLAVLIFFVVLFVVGRIRKNRFVEEARSSTMGIIRDVEETMEIDEDGRRVRTRFWIVEYRVDNVLYRLKQEASMITHQEMLRHIGDEVSVYYVPNQAYRAWASTPGYVSCINAHASGKLIRDEKKEASGATEQGTQAQRD